jgi:hypothetical protein
MRVSGRDPSTLHAIATISPRSRTTAHSLPQFKYFNVVFVFKTSARACPHSGPNPHPVTSQASASRQSNAGANSSITAMMNQNQHSTKQHPTQQQQQRQQQQQQTTKLS